MDKVLEVIDGIFDIYQENREQRSINLPSWKSYQDNYYKYYLDNSVSVNFDLESKKLTIVLEDLSRQEEYKILYPRYTSRGNDQGDNRFFNFYFKVSYGENLSGTIIVRAETVKNLRELYNSQLNVIMESRDDFLSTYEISGLQEYIYRQLGLGNGIGEIAVGNEDLKRLYITRSEYLYSINYLLIRLEENYLKERLAKLDINRSLWADILEDEYDSRLLQALGLNRCDTDSIKYVNDLRRQNSIRQNRLESGRSKYHISLEDIVKDLSRAISLEELDCFASRKNVMQVLKESDLSLEDVDIYKLIHQVVCRMSQTNLSILEMLDLIFNHRRSLAQAFGLEDMRKTTIEESIKAIF